MNKEVYYELKQDPKQTASTVIKVLSHQWKSREDERKALRILQKEIKTRMKDISLEEQLEREF